MVRLKPEEIKAIKTSVQDSLADAKIFLYGSRADDSKQGGDIDLLILTEQTVDLQIKSKIYSEICQRIGEQKIDILYAKPNSSDPFVQIVSLEAVSL